MKKIIFALIITLSISSCSKDNDSNNNRKELIIGLWNLDKINGENVGDNGVPGETLDIQYEFKSNGDFTAYVNGKANKENIWKLNSNNSIITFNNDPYTILTLTTNKMKLLLPFSDPSLSIEYDLSKQE